MIMWPLRHFVSVDVVVGVDGDVVVGLSGQVGLCDSCPLSQVQNVVVFMGEMHQYYTFKK